MGVASEAVTVREALISIHKKFDLAQEGWNQLNLINGERNFRIQEALGVGLRDRKCRDVVQRPVSAGATHHRLPHQRGLPDLPRPDHGHNRKGLQILLQDAGAKTRDHG